MLTRLRIDGFKNLVDVDIRFGSFTCIAGANGVGKSNLFDAIKFLSDLADQPLIDAAISVRDESGKASDIRGIFRKFADHNTSGPKYSESIRFEAEMIVPKYGVDDLGQQATATSTFLRYILHLAYRKDNGFSSAGGLEVVKEELVHINVGKAKEALLFDHSKSWRDSVIGNKRTVEYISTVEEQGNRIIKLHQDGKQGGSPVRRNAKTLPRTVLSSTNAVENPTALLVRNEMRSWRLLQLEPSALRKPDEFNAPIRLGEDGSHIASTLFHLAQIDTQDGGPDANVDCSKIYGQVASRLSELIEDVYAVGVERDEKRELLTLNLTTLGRVSYPAKSLSDGTLRFLALAVIELDPNTLGVICLEEPENGIHPERIPAILRLLKDIAVDVNEPVGIDNPLRQVVINTHSPVVVQQVSEDALLAAELVDGGVRFSSLSNTWRSKDQDARIISKGKIQTYLNPSFVSEHLDETYQINGEPKRRSRRVMDRTDLQQFLPYYGDHE
jgi:predicted ATPase